MNTDNKEKTISIKDIWEVRRWGSKMFGYRVYNKTQERGIDALTFETITEAQEFVEEIKHGYRDTFGNKISEKELSELFKIS